MGLSLFIILAVTVGLLTIIAIISISKARAREGIYPKGHWMGMGIGIGLGIFMPLGMIFGILIDNIALGISLGPALGTGVGCGIGAGLEQKHKNDLNIVVVENPVLAKRSLILGLVILSLGLILLVTLYISK
jgi:hypothetical protein